MLSIRKKIKFVVRAIAAGALFIATIGASGGLALAHNNHNNTLYVSTVGCLATGPGTKSQPYCKIQEAVDAASSGDTIKVDKGNYLGPVDVTKSLTLLGYQASKCDCATRGRTDPSKETIVNAGGTNGMTLNADKITVKGFSFSGNTTGPGVSTSKDFSGYKIINNIFSGNVFGLYLNSSGVKKSEVSCNRFDSNNSPGSASGNGIYSDQGVKNVEIDHNKFIGQQNAAMTFVVSAINNVQMDLKIEKNQANGPGPMLILVGGQNITFKHNDGSGFVDGAGVFLGGSNSDVRIKDNDLRGAVDSITGAKLAASGIRINVDQASYGTPSGITLVANTNITVENNDIKNFGDAGISVGNSDGTTVTLTNSTIKHNNIRDNGDTHAGFDAGILIRANNTGLTIKRNKMRNNQLFDAQDDNAPGANTWDNNNCNTSQPLGLCT